MKRFRLGTLVGIWIFTLAVIVTVFILSQTSSGTIIKTPTFQILSNILAFATFVVTSFLSFSIIRNSDEVNARNESFRALQFIADHYSAVDFVDHMLIDEVYKRYKTELKNTKNFQFYMREEDITIEDVCADFSKYTFVTLRVPVVPVMGGDKAVTGIRFTNFVFHKEDGMHHFVSCVDGKNTLLIYNKADKRQEVVINLIAKKTSEFWTADAVNPFLKITFNHTTYSMLGVSLSGWTELYFVNPHKVEKSGANKYLINSSQFEISGLPKLSDAVEADIIRKR